MAVSISFLDLLNIHLLSLSLLFLLFFKHLKVNMRSKSDWIEFRLIMFLLLLYFFCLLVVMWDVAFFLSTPIDWSHFTCCMLLVVCRSMNLWIFIVQYHVTYKVPFSLTFHRCSVLCFIIIYTKMWLAFTKREEKVSLLT